MYFELSAGPSHLRIQPPHNQCLSEPFRRSTKIEFPEASADRY
jgi:hypothetical protein